MIPLTERYTHAIDYARLAHATHVRKGTHIPYLYHLLAVSSLVLAHGGNEDQAIAGLLHDVLEDCGHHHEPQIRERFGPVVAGIVLDCTDGTAEGKAVATNMAAKRANWRERKITYIEHLKAVPETTLLVSACDKLHNASAIVEDLENPAVGVSVFERFTAAREDTLAYYQSLAELFHTRGSPVARVYEGQVARMHAMAGQRERRPLV